MPGIKTWYLPGYLPTYKLCRLHPIHDHDLLTTDKEKKKIFFNFRFFECSENVLILQ